MDNSSKQDIAEFDWQDGWFQVRISITLTLEMFTGFDHIEIRSINPHREPLPITKTGYHSHFAPTGEFPNAASCVELVKEWLNKAAAKESAWQSTLATNQQHELF